jgi:hypothetical protein
MDQRRTLDEDDDLRFLGGEPPADMTGMAVMRDTEGRYVMVPATRSGRLLKGERLLVYGDLQVAMRALEEARSALDIATQSCREAGISWSLIGYATGLTTEGARKRFAPPDLDA